MEDGILNHPSLSEMKMGLFRYITHLKIIAGAVGLLGITLGFSVWFAFITWEKVHIRTKLDRITPIGVELQKSIEDGLRYEAYLEKPITPELFLQKASIQLEIETKQRILNRYLNLALPEGVGKSHSTIKIVSDRKKIIYGKHLYGSIGNDFFQTDFSKKIKKIVEKDIFYINDEHYYHLIIPIRNAPHEIDTYIVIQTESKYVEGVPKPAKVHALWAVSILATFSTLLLLFLIPFLMQKQLAITRKIKRRITVMIFLILCSTQIVFFLFAAVQFYLDAHHNNRAKANIILAIMDDDLEQLLDANVEFSLITGMESYFDAYQRRYPEMETVSLMSIHSREAEAKFYHSQSISRRALQTEPIIHMLHDRGDNCHGLLIGRLSTSFLIGKLIDITLDLSTVVIITVLLIVELLILLFILLETGRTPKAVHKTIHYRFMRPASFLFLFGIDISMSFLPLHAENLYSPFLGLSKDTIMGLPISVEFLFVGISIFISGFWNDRRGWHEPFLTGLFLSALGCAYSWIAPDIFHFILSRALVGIGYGFMLLAAQGFVIKYTDDTNRAQGLAQFIAGLYAGSICGGATGGLLADHFGYRSVFLFGAIILFGVMIYTFVFLRHAMVSKALSHTGETELARDDSKWKSFFKNKVVLALIFFSSLPASIAVVGFLNYFSPIYLNTIGASQATIGRVLMIYGVSLIYIGPIISRHVDASGDKKKYIFIGCVLGSVTFLSFHFFNGLTAAILGVFLLGLSSSFVIASQGAYLLNLPVTQRLGPGKAIGVFRASSRIGQALGPLVFSLVASSSNVGTNISQMGWLYLLTAFLFLLLTYGDKYELERSQT
jgi:predicted MFS family arabinose efflux permease